MVTSAPSPLACILVHYGSVSLTLDCIASLLRCTLVPWVIVVSNASTAETEQLAMAIASLPAAASLVDGPPASPSASSAVTIIQQQGNSGFAAACNAGLRLALSDPAVRHLWLLNNDTTVAPNAPAALLHCLEQKPRCIVGSSVFCADQAARLELVLGCRFSPWTSRLRPCLQVPDNGQIRVDYVYGASIAFSRHAAREVGLLDEQFFLYYEEHDFCVRARKAGYSYHWCREAAVWHVGGKAQKNGPHQRAAQEFAHYHENRATFRFIRKHHPWALPVALTIRTLAKLTLLPLRGKAFLLRSYVRALRDF